MGSWTGLPPTNIGAHSTRIMGELALHAHGDLLLKLRQDVRGRIDDLVHGDVLAEEEGPVSACAARQLVPWWVGHCVGVPDQGGHGERRTPAEEAGQVRPRLM